MENTVIHQVISIGKFTHIVFFWVSHFWRNKFGFLSGKKVELRLKQKCGWKSANQGEGFDPWQ